MVGLILGVVASFIIFTIASHPRSKINKKLPDKKIKNFQFFPRITVSIRNRMIHFHHWLLLTPFYIWVQNAEKGLFHSDMVQGLVLGGIMQGLMFKDRFRLVVKREEFHKVKDSGFHIPRIPVRLRRRISNPF